MELSPQTWRLLGLSVAVSYCGLGSIGITQSSLAAKLFGLYPASSVLPLTETSSDLVNGAPPTAEDAIATSMILLGARDLSIGVALLAFDYNRMDNSMGILISSGMILCAVDVYYIWKLRGAKWGTFFLAGASIWGVIGTGLLA